MASSNAADLSYASVLASLQACGERLRKNRRNIAKAIPQATADLDALLFTLRQHTMNDACPSHRSHEAQVLMSKAVVKRHAGHRLEEAQCYLLAEALWTAIERERRGANFPTAGDALARSIACSAMACNVLLSSRYPAGQNPIPLRAMGNAAAHISSDPATFQTNGLWCPHLSRAWAVCYRLAKTLRDFDCIEMSADYFELAAIIVSVDAHGNDEAAPSATAEAQQSSSPSSTHHLHAHRPAAVRSHPHGGSNAGGGESVTSGSASSPPQQQQQKAAHPHHLHRGGGVPPPPSSSASLSTAAYSHHGHYAAPATAPTPSGRPARGAKAAPTIGVAPGMSYHFVLALLCCARACVVLQDYPRALSVIDELNNYSAFVTAELAEHVSGRAWEARSRRVADGGENANAAKAAVTTPTRTIVSEAAVQRLSRVIEAANCGEGAVATALAKAAALAAAGGEGTAEEGEEKVKTEGNTDAHQDPNANVSNKSSNGDTVTDEAKAADSSDKGQDQQQQAATTPATASTASSPAPRAYSADPAHHLMTLVELNAAVTQARLMKFAIGIILAEADAATVAHEQITYLRHLAGVWSLHTDSTARVGLVAARNPSLAALIQSPEGTKASTPPQEKDEKSSDDASSSSSASFCAIAHSNETARHLHRLATTMEMIVEESGWASRTALWAQNTNDKIVQKGNPTTRKMPLPTAARDLLSRRVLERCAGELVEIMALLGAASRDVTILVQRMLHSLLTSRLTEASGASAAGGGGLSKDDVVSKLQTAAALRSSIAAVPKQYSFPAATAASSAPSAASEEAIPGVAEGDKQQQ